MIDRLNKQAKSDVSPRERLDTAIDEAHSEMVTYRQLPELSIERRVHFNAFLRRMEELHAAARDCQAQYPMAYVNRMSQTGRGGR